MKNKILHEIELAEMILEGLNAEIRKAVYERNKASWRSNSLKNYYKTNGLGDMDYAKIDAYREDIIKCGKRVDYLRQQRKIVYEQLKILHIRFKEESLGRFYICDECEAYSPDYW